MLCGQTTQNVVNGEGQLIACTPLFLLLYEMKGLCFGELASGGFLWENTKPMRKRHFCSLRSLFRFLPRTGEETPLAPSEWTAMGGFFFSLSLFQGWFGLR